MMSEFELLKYFIFASVIIYFIFDFLDKKKIQDEREELIRLKTYSLVHKTVLATISFLSLCYLLYPTMPAFVPLIFTVIASMYAEIFAKFYFRAKL